MALDPAGFSKAKIMENKEYTPDWDTIEAHFNFVCQNKNGEVYKCTKRPNPGSVSWLYMYNDIQVEYVGRYAPNNDMPLWVRPGYKEKES